jgi:hypothetical protein
MGKNSLEARREMWLPGDATRNTKGSYHGDVQATSRREITHTVARRNYVIVWQFGES